MLSMRARPGSGPRSRMQRSASHTSPLTAAFSGSTRRYPGFWAGPPTNSSPSQSRRSLIRTIARLTRSCVRKSDGSVDYFVAVVEDISARKRAEEQLHLLMREANHRVKNLLSLVQAIARQTAAGNVEGFIGRFTERIQALAANQDLLGRDGGREPIWRTWYAL